MREFTFSQAKYMSGIGTGDDPFVQDAKIQAWLGSCKYRMVHGSQSDPQRQKAIQDGIEVLIIKEQ